MPANTSSSDAEVTPTSDTGKSESQATRRQAEAPSVNGDGTATPTAEDSAKDITSLTAKPEPTSAVKPSVIRPLRRRGARTDQLPFISETADQDGNKPEAEPKSSNPIRLDPPRIESVVTRTDEMPARPFAKPDPARETAVLSDNNPILKRMMRQTTTGGTASLGKGREVILVIRGMVERIVMLEDHTYKLGRFELSARSDDEIDLSPYGALDRGVSRIHAELHVKGENIFITDLTSTNGTYLSGTRLKANEPTLVRKGDELLIGRLPIQVLFR